MITSRLSSRTALVIALAGVFDAWMLSYAHWFHIYLPCSEASACDAVARSPAAQFAGVPTAIFGLAMYVFLAFVAARSLMRDSKWLWSAAYGIALLGSLISLGLTYYSLKTLRTHCDWCIASNLLICALATVFGMPRDSHVADWTTERRFITASLAVALALTIGGPMTLNRTSKYFSWDDSVLQATNIENLETTDSIANHPKRYVLTAVAFIDMSCPRCHEFVLRASKLAESKQIRIILRHFPLATEPESYKLAVITECANRQGRGWQFVSQVVHDERYSLSEFNALAASLSIEPTVDRLAARWNVDRDLALAKRLKLNQTPSIIVITDRAAPKMMRCDDFEAKYF